MTVKHLLEGAMQHTRSRNHHQLTVLTGLNTAAVSRMAAGKNIGMTIRTLDRIQRTTGVPIDTLFAWYRLPDGATLGRIQTVT